MKAMYKMVGIMLGLQFVAIFKNTTTRYIIREWFRRGELTAFQFAFEVFNLTPKKVLGLGIIASFTLVTFPLGIWLASFKMGHSYPILGIVGASLNLVTFPFTLYTMSRVLGELEFNSKVWTGIGLIVLSKLIIILGLWFMYRGNIK
jgi:hypothetical protein